jgi:uncharacterized protein YecA (UPF0149 family)
MTAEALYPVLLQKYADGFSRMEMSLDLLAETLSILYFFHDPEAKYNLAVKIAELNVRFGLETRQDPQAPVRLITEFYASVTALLDDIAKEKKNERAVKKLAELSIALLDLHGGGDESAVKVCSSWLIAVLKGMIQRFNIPTKSPSEMQDYVDRTFEPSLASMFHYAVAMSGKLSKGEAARDDLVLVVSLLIILTSKVNTIRKDALDLMKQGILPETGRNDPCPCGSGKKYKNCCMVS